LRLFFDLLSFLDRIILKTATVLLQPFSSANIASRDEKGWCAFNTATARSAYWIDSFLAVQVRLTWRFLVAKHNLQDNGWCFITIQANPRNGEETKIFIPKDVIWK